MRCCTCPSILSSGPPRPFFPPAAIGPTALPIEDEQRRALNFARLGYVVLAPVQNHYEDLNIGVSHQTLMVWNNMRALDLLESLPEVDRNRIGVAGGSGGGLQSEMLVGLDPRVKAATIHGMCCDFRRILFPFQNHCTCNHYPGVMRLTDGPEISTLGLPAAVQYLTMDDWTATFRQDNLPTIQKLYAANGVADRVDCRYYNTAHIYDKPKREATYEWMERWLHGRPAGPVKEPDDSKPFSRQNHPIAHHESARQQAHLGGRRPAFGLVWGVGLFGDQSDFQPAMALSNANDCRAGRVAKLPRPDDGRAEKLARPRRRIASQRPNPMGLPEQRGNVVVQRVDYPSEGPVLGADDRSVPADAGSGKNAGRGDPKRGRQGSPGGGDRAGLAHGFGPGGLAGDSARSAHLWRVVRHRDRISQPGDVEAQRSAWERNGIVWGRPVPAMGCTDLCGILNAVLPPANTAWPNVDAGRVSVIVRGSPAWRLRPCLPRRSILASARPTSILPRAVSRNATCRWFPMSCAMATCFNGQPWRPIAS